MEKIGILVLGFVFLGVGIWLTWKSILIKLKCTVECDAEITDVKRHSHKSKGYNRERYYSPIIKYVVDGNEYGGEADVSSIIPNKYKTGEMLTIKYNPNEPGMFCVKGKLGNIKTGVLCFLLGILFVVFGFRM